MEASGRFAKDPTLGQLSRYPPLIPDRSQPSEKIQTKADLETGRAAVDNVTRSYSCLGLGPNIRANMDFLASVLVNCMRTATRTSMQNSCGGSR
jgi:hypothetical protein